MQVQRNSIFFVRFLIDYLLISIVFIVGILFSSSKPEELLSAKVVSVFIFNLFIWYFSSKTFGLYDEYRGRDLSFELISLLKTIYVITIATIVILFFLKETKLSRAFIIFYSVGLFLIVGAEKIILRKVLYRLRNKGRNLRSLLIIGAGDVGKSFMTAVENNPHFGYNIFGFLDDQDSSFLNNKYLGKIEELDLALERNEIDNVVIALPNYATDKLEEVIRVCNRHTTRVKIIPNYFKFVSAKYSISMFGPFPVITVREDKVNEFHWRLIKRAFDTTFSFLLFVLVFFWLWPLIALAIKLDSKGPVFFKQERWGRDNRRFYAYKFRSMEASSKDIDENGKFKQATKNDPRITRVGKILRKTNLDELPQFWNVLKGEMSVVGPRPHPEQLNMESREKVNLYMLRHLVKPGITGWAQVNGLRGETKDILQMQRRIDYDIWYIENWSFLLDMQIILKTVWNMVKGDPNAY